MKTIRVTPSQVQIPVLKPEGAVAAEKKTPAAPASAWLPPKLSAPTKVDAPVDPGTAKAAADNAEQALRGAVALRAQGGPRSKGRVQARLKAAIAATAVLRCAPDADAVQRLRGLVAQLGGAGVGHVELGALTKTLVQWDQGRVFAELHTASPSGAAAIEALIEGTPNPAEVRRLMATMFPGAAALGTTQAELRAALHEDLGDISAQLSTLMGAHGLSQAQSGALFDMMSEVRAGFMNGTLDPAMSAADRDMQRTNWVHTRVEVLKAAQAFEAALPAPNPPDPAHAATLMSTLMGSLCSDAFKQASPHSLLWHNRAGAELVLPLLASRHLDLSSKEGQGTLRTAMQLAHEHQITPPVFMAGAMNGQLAASGASPEVIKEVGAKLSEPLNAPEKDGEISFSPEALSALKAIGVPGWATMDPDSPHFVASQVVALADVLQYVAPDGIIKIAVDIRDPEQPMGFMRDAHIRAAVDSSVNFSFDRGMEVIVHEGLEAWGHAQAQAMKNGALQNQIYPEVERRLAKALGLPSDRPLPRVPYWNQDVSVNDKLSDKERQSVDLVKATLRDVMADFGQVPLDPFGANKE